MKRREFITLLGGAAASSSLLRLHTAHAQQGEQMRRLGVLMGIADDAESQSRVAAFRQALQTLGWIEGDNVEFKYRWGAIEPEQARQFVNELLEWRPDVILSNSTPMTVALSKATSTTPIVFVNVSDPVAAGVAQTFARPGGNLTGFAIFDPSLAGKWLELLKGIAPSTTRVMYLFNPDTAPVYIQKSVRAAMPLLSMDAHAAPVRSVSEIEPHIEEFARTPNGALLVLPDIFTSGNRQPIITLAARHRLPALYPFKHFVKDGGLISYGIEAIEPFRQAASYVDRILRGGKPAELPVQAPTKFELVLNLKTARALGLTIPDRMLAIADEVIE